jgi:hypothetical protein
MKEFIEKLIGRLEEEKKQSYYKATSKSGMSIDMGENIAYGKAIQIVNQLAEEYKLFGNSEQVNGKDTNVTTNDLMVVQSLPSLYPLKDFEEEAIHRVVENNRWIPCDKQLPGEEYILRIEGAEFYKHVLTSTQGEDAQCCVGWYDREDDTWYDIEGFAYHPIAWRPLPEPYQLKE